MNWLVIVVLAVLVLSVLNGYNKGFLRMIYSLVSWIIVLVFVTWANPYINNYIRENTGLYERIASDCEERIRESAKGKTQEQVQENAALAELGINLPDSVAKKILAQTTTAADEFMEDSGLYAQIAGGLADFVLEGISFFIALIAAWILVHIISQLLGIVSHIPILKGVNRFLGIFAGGLYGLVIVWIAFYIIALCGTSPEGSALLSYICESSFLTFLYENNLVVTIFLYFL